MYILLGGNEMNVTYILMFTVWNKSHKCNCYFDTMIIQIALVVAEIYSIIWGLSQTSSFEEVFHLCVGRPLCFLRTGAYQ